MLLSPSRPHLGGFVSLSMRGPCSRFPYGMDEGGLCKAGHLWAVREDVGAPL